MSDLKESEVVDRMKQSLREAGQAALDLAGLPRRGKAYKKLREHLELVEGCCRQLAVFRDDARWLNMGMTMHKAHEMSGGWLRGFKDAKTGRRIAFATSVKNPLFQKLAENLAFMLASAEAMLTKRTGVMGPILPVVRQERRVGAPIRVKLPEPMRKTAGGVLLPPGTSVH